MAPWTEPRSLIRFCSGDLQETLGLGRHLVSSAGGRLCWLVPLTADSCTRARQLARSARVSSQGQAAAAAAGQVAGIALRCSTAPLPGSTTRISPAGLPSPHSCHSGGKFEPCDRHRVHSLRIINQRLPECAGFVCI